ncbi:MAG: hypothetical protein PHT97_05880 [Methanoculleus sp.]|uniref:hypothetical protein n=2 Tax=Methanoculleus TaxID=45989 RepID=UPI0025FD0C80|nr:MULTISPECIES: hypothetical protein [unclassified Methanoculleus]MCK9317682.1 hypothetical protein [Methanoculleus sp.]MDD2253780.1 hypothetical protein [Methanoculleus sp.]MDD3216325.1 hypothetical protein [Methanoculleus sp.]MDD4313910.1 hypothetical protein [Methanoculleus sp.]MDD4470672.1 hypothetical protein [Methanoculleus sp.]
MKVADILEVDGCRLVEPSFAELTIDACTALLFQGSPDEARLLVDEEEEPLAFALHDGSNGWHAASFLFRDPTIEVIECFEAVGGDIYQESREAWLSAVREYYSLDIRANVVPALEDLRPDREGNIRDLVTVVWGDRAGTPCLDCCCGSGVGTAALRAGGVRALAYDNDPALLALGLTRGRLAPADTICIDAQEASRYIAPVPLGVAFMAGEIYSYNANLWESIVTELLILTDETLITVGTEAEAARVEEWCAEEDRETEVFENRRDPIYDRWCCVARRV